MGKIDFPYQKLIFRLMADACAFEWRRGSGKQAVSGKVGLLQALRAIYRRRYPGDALERPRKPELAREAELVGAEEPDRIWPFGAQSLGAMNRTIVQSSPEDMIWFDMPVISS